MKSFAGINACNDRSAPEIHLLLCWRLYALLKPVIALQYKPLATPFHSCCRCLHDISAMISVNYAAFIHFIQGKHATDSVAKGERLLRFAYFV